MQILNAALPAVGPVQAVVGIADQHHMGGIDRAAEELHAIVQIVIHLNVIDRGAAANALEGDAVQLVLRIHIGAGELDHHIAQDAAAVVGVVAAEQAGVGLALLGALRGAAVGTFRAVVDGRVAVDDQAAPEPLGVLRIGDGAVDVLHCGQGDGCVPSAVGFNPGASGDDQKVLRVIADDGGAGLDVQHAGSRFAAHRDLAVQDVVVVAGQGDLAGEGSGQLAGLAAADGVDFRGARGAAEIRGRVGHADRPTQGPVLIGVLHRADEVGRLEQHVAGQVSGADHLAGGRYIAAAKQVVDGGRIVALHQGAAVEADAVEPDARAQLIEGVPLHPQASFAVLHHGVVEFQAGAAPQANGPFARIAGQGHVGDARQGARFGGLVPLPVVGLDAVVTGVVRLVDDQVLEAALPAVGPVQAVVGVAGEHQMLGADRAAEELHAVVQIVMHLDVIHFRAGTHALEGDAVQLVLRIDIGAGVLDHDVVQPAAGVVAVGPAEQAGIGLALLGALGGAAIGPFGTVVDGRIAVDHQAAPLAPGAGKVGLPGQVGKAGEGDGRRAGAVGDDAGAPGNHQKVLFSAAVDGGAGLNGQVGGSLVVAADDHLAHQLVEVVAGQQQVAGDGAGQLANPRVV